MIHARKTGLALANLVCGIHVIWILLVLVGWAQPLINFIHWAHMLVPDVQVAPFSLTAAITLIVVTWLVGYIVGMAFATSWNRLHR